MDQLIASHGVDGLLKCLLSLGHLVGLALGMGTTAFLDGGCILSIANRSWDRYRAFMSGALFRCATGFVIIGLALLWLTGIGFLVHYAVFAPEKLANPKIYAKLALVTVLTANGALLHHSVLRRVADMDDLRDLLSTTAGRLLRVLWSGFRSQLDRRLPPGCAARPELRRQLRNPPDRMGSPRDGRIRLRADIACQACPQE